MAEVLRAAGAIVEVHADHFADDEKDERWLKAIGGRGWVVLSKDSRILKREIEKDALIRWGVSAFFLRKGDLKGGEMGAIFLTALPRMIRLIEATAGPVRAIVRRDSGLNILDSALKPVVIERSVTRPSPKG